MSELAENDALDAILVALWQCETEAGYEHVRTKVEKHVHERMAEAWDEGDTASDEWHRKNEARKAWEPRVSEPDNPYRTGADA